MKRGEYINPFISALAVIGVRDDGGWVAATEYTLVYLAVIKTARMAVVEEAYQEQEAVIRRLMGAGKDEDNA